VNEIDEWTLHESITVKDLIELLEKYPKEMKCVFTWESIFRTFKEENLYPGNEQVLLFDADENFYKDRYENAIRIEL
jgi:hypothetical protein